MPSRSAESELGPDSAKRQKLESTDADADLAIAPPPSAPPAALEPVSLNAASRHTAEYGNYHGYYTKRKVGPQGDARLAVIPPDWLRGARVLDVGCNSGVVTIELAQKFGPARITGVDIDDTLIATARKNIDLAWSRQAPSPAVLSATRSLSLPPTRDLPPHTRPSSTPPSSSAPPSLPPTPSNLSYFPLALPRLLGYLPQPPRDVLTTYEAQPEVETTGITKRGRRKVMPVEILAFPDNVSFRTADWPNVSIPSDRKGYNVILAFSVTKWIHLHTLNAGLLTFFSKCFSSLLPGGLVNWGRLVGGKQSHPFPSFFPIEKNMIKKHLSIAVCLCPGVTLSDFVTPIEILGHLNFPVHKTGITVDFEYLSPTMAPVQGFMGVHSPAVHTTRTYDAALAGGKQYDILWVPAGPDPTRPDKPELGILALPPSLVRFLRQQAPKARYIMSVCGGSYILGHAGLLRGKKATTNKFMFNRFVELSPKGIEWVKQARWVVDGNTWTSSGVAAGSDMALAFIAHLTDDHTADLISGVMEIRRAKDSTDDPFAKVHSLL
ncbi:hypothetical protein RQP46_001040 [Phenoliferia psychrophenolica]